VTLWTVCGNFMADDYRDLQHLAGWLIISQTDNKFHTPMGGGVRAAVEAFVDCVGRITLISTSFFLKFYRTLHDGR